jgi:hypothetical protein
VRIPLSEVGGQPLLDALGLEPGYPELCREDDLASGEGAAADVGQAEIRTVGCGRVELGRAGLGGRPGRLLAHELSQARQALSDADGAADADLSDATVINRCYCACFHAAQADYGPGPLDVAVTELLSEARSFVTTTGTLVEGDG